MLRFSNVSFSMEGRPLFVDASAVIPTGHKVGFVGRNGTGKTTLFHLINNKLTLDGGEIEVPRDARVGGVAQEAPATQDSLLETVLQADTERMSLLAEAETAKDANRIAEIHTRLADIDAYSAEARAAAILDGLGFDTKAQARPCADFSGGWRMRVALAAILFAQPDVLLLDEPTNYLDLEGALWLEGFLAKYPHTVLVISHDRGLLNRSVNSILHLDQQKLTLYTGNYDTFDSVRRAKMAEQEAMKKKQDREREHIQSFVDRFRAKASKAKQAQSRLKMLERMKPISGAIESSVSGFNFPNVEELSPPIIKLDDASVGYGNTTILHKLNLRIDPDDRIALLGANGQGKSTLSKLLADRLQPMGGKVAKSSKLRIGYFAQHQVDELNLDETPLQHIQALRPTETPARVRSRLATGGLGPAQADTKVGKLSGGQKARLAMLIVTIDKPHMVILDEPTNHLDIESREALVRALADFEGAVILVSHDPYLVEMVADRLWLVKGGKVVPYEDDMDAYRKLLLSERGSGGQGAAQAAKPKKDQKRTATEMRKILAPYRAEVTKAEERVAKIEEMLTRIDTMLADPKLYETKDKKKSEALQVKRGEILDALAKAEAIWVQTQEKLDARKEKG